VDSRFHLLIKLKALGLEIPPTLRERVDEASE
jgi:hypothetical protein